jgi:hypothetical protein
MWDVIPCGYNSQGNEISLTVFLNSNQSEDCVGRAEILETQIRTGDKWLSEIPSPEAELRKAADRLLNEYLVRYKSSVPQSEQKPAEPKDDLGLVSYDEHIAGPNCVANANAYSGYQLS